MPSSERHPIPPVDRSMPPSPVSPVSPLSPDDLDSDFEIDPNDLVTSDSESELGPVRILIDINNRDDPDDESLIIVRRSLSERREAISFPQGFHYNIDSDQMEIMGESISDYRVQRHLPVQRTRLTLRNLGPAPRQEMNDSKTDLSDPAHIAEINLAHDMQRLAIKIEMINENTGHLKLNNEIDRLFLETADDSDNSDDPDNSANLTIDMKNYPNIASLLKNKEVSIDDLQLINGRDIWSTYNKEIKRKIRESYEGYCQISEKYNQLLEIEGNINKWIKNYDTLHKSLIRNQVDTDKFREEFEREQERVKELIRSLQIDEVIKLMYAQQALFLSYYNIGKNLIDIPDLCSICTENKKNRFLPCGHTMCEICVDSLFEASGERRTMCPFCSNFIQKRELKPLYL